MKKTIGICLGLLLSVLALTVSGCQQPAAQEELKSEVTVVVEQGPIMPSLAVIPFENYSTDPNAGLVLMSSLQGALAERKAPVLTPGEVKEKLKDYDGSFLSPQKLGEVLKVDAIVCGDVNEYRYVYGTGEQPSLTYNVRVIDVKSGEAIWSKAVSANGNFSWMKESSLGEAARQSARSTARGMISALEAKRQAF